MHIENYPRPQLVRPEWTNLNGEWDFAFDRRDVGKAEKWNVHFPQSQKIVVPFTYETKLSGIGIEKDVNVVWYHRKLPVSRKDLSNERLILHMEGCDYYSEIYVNGVMTGSHTGAYSRANYDITDALDDNENYLTVRIEDSRDKSQPRGKQRWLDDNYGCWYVQTTGIWKTVWLEKVPSVYIQALRLTPSAKKCCVDFDMEVNQLPVDNEKYVAQFRIMDGEKEINTVSLALEQKKVSGRCFLYGSELHNWGIKLWSPEHPNLYDIEVTLVRDEQAVDKVYSYFGLRDICCSKGQILLNGVPLYERLILDQGYWKDSGLTPPSEEALIEDIDKTLALGYNGVRKHQKVEDERYLYWADVKGLLVWSEVGAFYDFTEKSITDFTQQWIEIVRENYNHPCIITWTPFNESWGIRQVKTNRQEQEFTEGIYYLTKSLDSTRPVIANDGWEHTISDIITIHDYAEDGDEFYRHYMNHIQEILKNERFPSREKAAFADGYEYKGQPIMITEYGGIAFQTDKGWGYGNQVSDEKEFLNRFKNITEAIKRIPWCCGYCYTQLTDVQQEVNGLLSENRAYKVSPDKVKAINEIPAGE
ncbi:MAG: glycoside hydrolase family 2 TIM barrel-domain containing protein [Eubacteriales bacterium]|nr:glycoside hydrolase family 2 TIM barrel-domain containing protein [Eubacteriales bacterium]